MITTIVFDIGGVFLHQPQPLLDEVWRHLGVEDSTAAQDVMFGGELWDSYKRGGMTEEQYWTRLAEQLPIQYEGSWSSLCRAFERSVVLDTDLAILVRDLTKKFRIHALSNAGAELERRLNHFGIDNLFGKVVNSHYVKMAKPDREIYQYTSEIVGARPEEILFVDDKLRNTLVAAELGFSTHVYTTKQSFYRFLLQSGLVSEEAQSAEGM